MKMVMIGLGRMGGNMARRLMDKGHEIVAFDRDADAVAKLVEAGAEAATSVDDARAKAGSPVVWWVMVPAGEITEGVINSICENAAEGEIVIDGGSLIYPPYAF